MSKATDAFEFLRREAERSRALADLLPELEKYSSFEQATKEAQSKLTAAKGDLETATARLNAANRDLVTTRAAIAQAGSDHEKLMKDRTAEADAILTKARRDAAAITDTATRAAAATRSETQDQVASDVEAGERKVATLTTRAAQLQATLDDLTTQVATKQAAMAKIASDKREALARL